MFCGQMTAAECLFCFCEHCNVCQLRALNGVCGLEPSIGRSEIRKRKVSKIL